MGTQTKFVLLLFYILAATLLSCALLSSAASLDHDRAHKRDLLGVRRLLLKADITEDEENDDEAKLSPPAKKTKTTTTSSSSTQSKLLPKSSTTSDSIKPKLKKLNSTSITPPSTKLSTSSKNTTLTTTKLKKLTNSTIASKPLSSNSTKSSTSKKSSDPITSYSTKLKNTTITTTPKLKKSKDLVTDTDPKSSKTSEIPKQKSQNPSPKPKSPPSQKPKTILPVWIEQEGDDDADLEHLVSDFRSLPSKFQQTLIPDLESISQTSRSYLKTANKQIKLNVKPYVGGKYAAAAANFVSFAFIILPVLLVSLLINHIKTYFKLQSLLIFIHLYLVIYFAILALSAAVTGLEPLRFFFATSPSTYVALQIIQTLCYVVYLVLLVMYLILVFATGGVGLGSRVLSLGQCLMGFAVGLHYYVAVFHRVVRHQPPKTNWKVHAVYSACFLVVCLFARAERRKKEYLEEGGEEGKKN